MIRALVRHGKRGCGTRRGSHGVAHRLDLARRGRILPQRTTCGGFWYFWPQKYKKKELVSTSSFRNAFALFGKTPEKLFLLTAFRWRKAAKATRPVPMAVAGRLKAASGDYSRVCKQTVPAAGASSRPSASRHRNQVGNQPCGGKISLAAGKERGYVAGIILIISIAAAGGTINPHSRSRRKKRVRRAARQSRGGA